jgi:signal transduction histidine kinase
MIARSADEAGERASALELPARVALDALPVGILIDTDDGLWANQELHRIWRRPESEPLDRVSVARSLTPLADTHRPTVTTADHLLYTDDERPMSLATIGEAGLTIAPGRFRLDRGDATTGVVRAESRLLVDSDGQPLGTIVLVSDETGIHDAERLRDAFLGILGHELRTPITSIVGGSELLRSEGLDPDIRREVAAALSDEADRLNRLVDQLIRLATLERRGSVAEPVHLVHAARRAAQRERVRFPRLRVDVVSDGRVPAAAGDEGFIGEVMTILLDNAAKYAGPAGRVTLVVSGSESSAEVHVLDEGPGVPASAGDIFGLFQRGAGADTSSRHGTGIGLFVARAIVEMMGGRIWASNRAEGGADVAFELPIAEG